jgi:hypothetical protein
MKKGKCILIYNYDYSRLGLTLEGEFFISSIFTLQTEIKVKSRRDFLLQYSKLSVYSYPQLNILIKKYADILFWDSESKKFQIRNDKWLLRKILIKENNETYLSFPTWLFPLNKVHKLNFTQLYIIALIVSYFYDRKEFNWANETIARKLGMVSEKSMRININKLYNKGLINIKPTNRTNILYVTDKLLDYEHFTR